jgi:DNA-binding GntR family transcriptional regulator
MATIPLRIAREQPDAASAVDMLRSHSLVSVLQVEIERMILDGELDMGDRLNELALAARFNISRGPIREACRSLAQAGLLEIQINRGFFVRKLAQKEVVDLYDLRAGLMHLAGELLAKNITPDQLAQIKAMVDAMDAAQRAGDAGRFRELNSDFHAALVEATDNRRLVEIYQGLAKEIQLFRRRGLVSASAMELSNREHRAIVEAIVAQDAARTAAAMQQHILQGKARFLAAAGASIYD